VSIDRKVTRHEEVLLTADDELYEVGSGRIAEELDEQLRGARAGDILKFNATLPGQDEVTFSVLVKEVREKVLPEVTDEWASEASEFETVEELRADIRSRSDAVKRLEAALAVREKVMEALVELVDDEMPRALVAAEMERRQEVLVHRLGHQGIQLEQYLQLTGTSPDQFFAQLEQQSIAAIKADLALRYVAEAEGVEVTDDDVAQEIATMAEREGVEEARVRKALESEGRLPEVLSGIRKSKALEWLIEHTEYVDEDGRVIERSELEPPSLQSPDRGPEREEGQQEQETPE
jgi:trigger factor